METDRASRYDRWADFYQQVHGGSIVERREPLSAGSMVMAAQAAGDWSDPPTPELRIAVIGRGDGTYSADFGAGRFQGRVRPSATIVVGPGTRTSIQRSRPHTIIAHLIPYADLLALAGDGLVLPASGDFGRVHAAPLDDPLVPTLVERLWRSAAMPSPAARLFGQGALLAIAASLVEASGRRRPAPLSGGLAGWQVERAVALMRARLDTGVSLPELAGEARLSPYHFARAFRVSTGMPPHRYQMSLRIDRARELLETTDLSVAEIAALVGYTDPSALARLFTRVIGVAPARYRRERR